MTKKNKFWIFLSFAVCLLFLLATSCSKDDDNNSKNTLEDIDGNVYHTITIGTQVWMVENLKTTKYRNGDLIPNITDATEWSNLSNGAYCDYNNMPSNSNTYGKLYNWYAVNDNRNIAPTGWHVPTDSEWATLYDYLAANSGTSGSIAKAIASKNNWVSSTEEGTVGNNLSINNSSGFTALPGGYRYIDGKFYEVGENCKFWSCTEYATLYAYSRDIEYYGSFHSTKVDGLSIRCLRD